MILLTCLTIFTIYCKGEENVKITELRVTWIWGNCNWSFYWSLNAGYYYWSLLSIYLCFHHRVEPNMNLEKRAEEIVEGIARIRARREKRQADKEANFVKMYGSGQQDEDKLVEQDDKAANFFRRYSNSNSFGIFRRRRKKKDFNIKGTETKRDKPKRKGLLGRLREPGRFFSKERIKERHDFRIKVSGNRKWIMIGLAVVAVCGTIIYLSVTYGGGGFSFVTKFLGVFK